MSRLKTYTKDPRTPRLFGLLLLFLAAYFSIAFVSYLFTWNEDQSNVHMHSFDLITQNIRVSNWFGRLGAIISDFFFYQLFGLPSFLFIYLLYIHGITIVNGGDMSFLARRRLRTLAWIILLSILFGYFIHSSGFPWGGKFGFEVTDWLMSFLGTFGVLVFILFALAGLFIWTFNPDTNDMTFSKAVETVKSGGMSFWTGRYESPEAPLQPTKNRRKKSETTGEDIEEAFDAVENAANTGGGAIAPAASLAPIRGEKNAVEEALANMDGTNALSIETTLRDDKEKPKALSSGTSDFEIETPQDAATSAEEPISVGSLSPTAKVQPTGPQGNLFDSEGDLAAAAKYGDLSTPYDPRMDLAGYEFPVLPLLNTYDETKVEIDRAELEQNKDQIIETLLNYKIEITKIRATVGPTVTLYEIVPAPGVRISKIKNLEDDIALSLAALGIRIIAPIPGRGTIGIEVPNKNRQTVSLREVLASDKFRKTDMELPIALGKNISNEVVVVDLAKMPHLLIAGATGQGKSVGINTILLSLLYKKHPSELKLVLIDPKKVELSPYAKIESHFLAFLPDQLEPIITDTSKVVQTLNSLCREMDKRYDLLKKAQARNIKEYNEKFIGRRLNPEKGHEFLPFIILVIDEFADLIMTAGKEVELPIGRLAQLARAVGIHLIIATQRPSVNIITGVIKANFPARLAFKVTSKIDSRTILDSGGADQLIGRGDMLLSSGSDVIRLQCAFVDTPEVERAINFIAEQPGYPVPFFLPEAEAMDGEMGGNNAVNFSDLDDMLDDAARLVVQNQHGSTSMIQRRLKLGYNRAGRIMDQLESLGIVGPAEGSKPREVLFHEDGELERFLADIRAKRG